MNWAVVMTANRVFIDTQSIGLCRLGSGRTGRHFRKMEAGRLKRFSHWTKLACRFINEIEPPKRPKKR